MCNVVNTDFLDRVSVLDLAEVLSYTAKSKKVGQKIKFYIPPSTLTMASGADDNLVIYSGTKFCVHTFFQQRNLGSSYCIPAILK